MSILTILIDRALDISLTQWELDRDEGSEPQEPSVSLGCRITIPVKDIDQDLWYSLDDGFIDPDTGTSFYCFDYDGDDDLHWGRFTITAHGSDVPEVLDVLRGEVESLMNLLTKLSNQNTTEV